MFEATWYVRNIKVVYLLAFFSERQINNMELISAVIITYKRPLDVLARAIQSVLRQTYKNIELIVVNDAPEEKELAKEISKYIDDLKDKRVKYIEHEKNSGANKARNTGFEHAAGKYIAYLDDDDEWLPEKLEVQVKAFDGYDNLGLVYSGFYIRNEESDDVEKPAIIPQDYLRALIEDNYIGSTSFPLLLTDAVRNVGAFDINQKSCQEYELWLRIASKYEIKGIPELLGIYYVSKDSTFKGNYNSYLSGDNAIISKHQKLFKKYPIEYSNHLLRMYFYMLREKEWRKAFYYKKRAICTCWYNLNNVSLVYIIRRVIKKI